MDCRKASYTDRPLTEEERTFAGNPENYNEFFRYMCVYRLDVEEWYDILILDYLRAVKKYCSIEDLKKFKFVQILFKTLDTGRSNFYRDIYRERRMPEGGYQNIISLDFIFSDGDTKEKLIPDIRQQVEQEAIDSQILLEIMQNISDIQRKILKMTLDGYKKSEVMKDLNITRPYLINQMEDIKEIAKNYMYESA